MAPVLQWGCGEQVHRMRTKKAGSGGVLRSVDDTCHGSRSTQNRKLAFLVLRTSGTTPSRQPHQSSRSHQCPLLPSFFPTRRRQACRSASPLLPAVQSGRRHCKIRSMRQQFIPPRPVGPGSWRGATAHRRRALHPLFMTALHGKIFNFAFGRETNPHPVWLPHYSSQGTYQRSRDRLSRKWPTTLRRAGRTCTLFWRRFPTVEVSNVEACFAISVCFKGEGGGLRMKLTFFVSQASANFCDAAPYVDFFLLALFWTTPTFIQMRLIAGIRKRCHFETAIKMNAQVVCITKPSPVAAPCGSCAIVYQFLSSAQQFADRPWKYVHVLTILGYSFLRG